MMPADNVHVLSLDGRLAPRQYHFPSEADLMGPQRGSGMLCILAGFIVCYAIISFLHSSHPHRQDSMTPPHPLLRPGVYAINSARKALSTTQSARNALIDPLKCKTINLSKGSVGNLVVADCEESMHDPLAWKTATEASKNLVDARTRAFLDEVDTAVIMIFAPWCGHCQTAAPKFASMSVGSPIALAMLNAESFPRSSFNPQVPNHIHPIKYFPTFLVMTTVMENGKKKKKYEEKHLADIAGFLDAVKNAPPHDSLQTPGSQQATATTTTNTAPTNTAPTNTAPTNTAPSAPAVGAGKTTTAPPPTLFDSLF